MAKPKPAASLRTGQPRLRCAVYTRKSSEEGLEQSFNSLDAQREACAAYISSQRHEGWQLVPALYDDGGYSGGTMERPALKRLLADVEAGKVDVVVVYKVDRLTRALSDFAKIVEVLDRRGASFVSVTQAFNTTSSMGRLTLNVLLSFAQFEREVTGERIRDKIAASKRKGMWMGGLPPLGYDVAERKLVVNEAEAETVRLIFRRYCCLRSVRLLAAELAQAGIHSKARRAADGGAFGGQPLGRGALYAMLANRLYRGEVVHKGEADKDKPQDARGADVSSEAAGGGATRAGQRIPAAKLEAVVTDHLRALLTDANALQDLARERSAPEQHAMVVAAARLAAEWPKLPQLQQRQLLQTLLTRIDVHAERIEIAIDGAALLHWLGVGKREETEGSIAAELPLRLMLPVRLKRVGIEMRLMLPGEAAGPDPDASLGRLLGRAHRIRERLTGDTPLSIDEVARAEGLTRSYTTRLLRLSYLAPDITARLIAGAHPPDLNAVRLMRDTRLPLDWAEQRASLAMA